MRQSWFSSLKPVAGSAAAAVIALLLTTANAPAQNRSDSGRNDSDSSSASDRNSDRSSSRSDDNAANQARASRRSANQSSHPLLGVLFYNDRSAPLEIRRVTPGTPADEAGLERGDEIISVDGQRISTVQQLRQQIDQIGTGEDIEFGVLRDGRQKTITARLTSTQQRSSSGSRRNQQQWSDDQYGYNRGYQQQRGGQEYGDYEPNYGQWAAHPEYDRGFQDGYAQAQHEMAMQGYGNQGYGNQGNGGQSYMRSSRGAGNWQTEGYRGSSGNHAFLGVTLDENDRNAARVSNIYPNSPAHEAGIRPGDEIVAIDDDDVQSADDVKRLLSQRDPDEDVSIEVNRNGRQRTLHATLASQQEFMSSNSGSYRMGRRPSYGQQGQQQGQYNDNRGSSRRQQNQNQNQDEENDNY